MKYSWNSTQQPGWDWLNLGIEYKQILMLILVTLAIIEKISKLARSEIVKYENYLACVILKLETSKFCKKICYSKLYKFAAKQEQSKDPHKSSKTKVQTVWRWYQSTNLFQSEGKFIIFFYHIPFKHSLFNTSQLVKTA